VVHILLIEDNPGDVLLVKRALQEHRIAHDMYVVRDGGEALDFVARMGRPGEAPCPDVLLLDLNLPKVDGPEVLGEFRKHPDCANTPVIVVTSSDRQEDRIRMAGFGIAHYFKKPIDLEAFLKLGSVVRDIIERRVA
jgi:CheY-like chemotaxis protein